LPSNLEYIKQYIFVNFYVLILLKSNFYVVSLFIRRFLTSFGMAESMTEMADKEMPLNTVLFCHFEPKVKVLFCYGEKRKEILRCLRP